VVVVDCPVVAWVVAADAVELLVLVTVLVTAEFPALAVLVVPVPLAGPFVDWVPVAAVLALVAAGAEAPRLQLVRNSNSTRTGKKRPERLGWVRVIKLLPLRAVLNTPEYRAGCMRAS
jgi:hypothetical protein